MRALRYAAVEAWASLLRGWRSAALAVLTIAAGLFVLGFFLIVNTNLQRVLARWGEAAELSVYFADDATDAQKKAVEDAIDQSGLASARVSISKDEAARRFREDFPDLAGTAAQLDRNPFPASVDVRLSQAARGAGDAVDRLSQAVGAMPGVADVRYDRRWLGRLGTIVGFVRGVGLLIVAMLALAAALTVANVVRLAAYARRDEIEIMQLVGAPLAYVRGPFVVEGVLQGGVGALAAVVALYLVFLLGRARYGSVAAEALGLGTLTFLPVQLCLLILVAGMLLGCLGAFVVARAVR